MHCSPMNIPSSTTPSSNVASLTQPRVFSHKRRRSATFAHSEKQQDEDNTNSATESCCTTSGESSGDESDDNSLEELIDDEEEETLVAAKRRRRADLDGLKKSVRCMEAQVVNASAQLKDLAAVVAQVVARRQLQQFQCSAPDCIERHTVDTHLAKCFSSL
ncbi:unnamed protein product [Peronospora destructor]|uniref:Uncharacterized protein n=1 Tax=Peronospora destructor TaxID=86335 RepID=A0AAV0UIP0_9STRA|nr:unnamed protein product [Peronospora destructor]